MNPRPKVKGQETGKFLKQWNRSIYVKILAVNTELTRPNRFPKEFLLHRKVDILDLELNTLSNSGTYQSIFSTINFNLSITILDQKVTERTYYKTGGKTMSRVS